MEILVPYQDRPLEPPASERVRRLRRHLVESLRDLRKVKRPERLIQSPPPAPEADTAAVLRAGCAACQGDCCLGGGEHAYLDERTMARVRRDRPDLDARGVIAAYVRDVAPLSYAGSCLFHGERGCTLDAGLRADLCGRYFCDGLMAFLRAPVAISEVTIRARKLAAKR
jgi:hypothetical protein